MTAPTPEQLVEEHIPLATLMATRARKRVPRLGDEALSAALFALQACSRGFKPELGFKFTTYLTRAVRTEIRRAIRRLLWRHTQDQTPGSRVEHFFGSMRDVEFASQRRHHEAYVDDRDLANYCLSLISTKQAEVMRLAYCEGIDERTICRMMGKSHSYAFTTKKVAVRRLRSALYPDGSPR